MRINKIDNAQNFKAIYKVKVSQSNIKHFEETIAPIYRASKEAGIRAFFKNPTEMFALTEKDAHEFDKKYNQLKRDKLILNSPKQESSDNIIQLPHQDNNFVKNFLYNKPVEIVDNFNKFLVQLFD